MIGVLIDLAGHKIRLGNSRRRNDDRRRRRRALVRGEPADARIRSPPPTSRCSTTWRRRSRDAGRRHGGPARRIGHGRRSDLPRAAKRIGAAARQRELTCRASSSARPRLPKDWQRGLGRAGRDRLHRHELRAVRPTTSGNSKQFIRGKNSPARVIAKISPRPWTTWSRSWRRPTRDGGPRRPGRGDRCGPDGGRAKEIIAACNRLQRPVIVATDADSMQHNLHPTRAEATDVANAVLDRRRRLHAFGRDGGGASAASGRMMHRIALATGEAGRSPGGDGGHEAVEGFAPDHTSSRSRRDRIADGSKPQLIVAASRSGPRPGRVELPESDADGRVQRSGFGFAADVVVLGIIPLWNAPR